ncbi:F-box family protein [Striga asiatica]|uniref:F-box family protein n=1 Tax=Striga asiatica TaxID=4170 RepID=A0A5A7PRF6_STRAF|nr:F-box family protein [Striga asiatica]
MGDETPLPQSAIQIIQSLLTRKEAARTATLSKSWRSAWLTSPHLELDDSDFERNFSYGEEEDDDFDEDDYDEDEEESGDHPAIDEFSVFAKKTVQRYEDSNLKIESFRLRMNYYKRCKWDDNLIGLAYELIVRALRLGATCLDLQLTGFSDERPILPHEVFEAENLVELSVEGYFIHDLVLDQRVRCSKLESLTLNDVRIKRDMVSRIISVCRLIKKLSLCKIKDNRLQSLGWVCDYLIDFHMLTSLKLQGMRLDSAFLDDLSFRFPNVKDLSLEFCYSRNKIQICSHSLERLELLTQGGWKPKVVLDVPRIRKLAFKCSEIPSVVFISDSKELYESLVSHVCYSFTHRWFLNVSKLLTELRRSKISLYLSVRSSVDMPMSNYDVEDLDGLPSSRHQLEHLMVETNYMRSLTCYAFFDGLFRLCCPKIITQRYPRRGMYHGHKTNNDFLSKMLERGTKGVFSNSCNFMYGLHDLEGVYVKPYDDDGDDDVWILKFNLHKHDTETVQFHLKWKSTS